MDATGILESTEILYTKAVSDAPFQEGSVVTYQSHRPAELAHGLRSKCAFEVRLRDEWEISRDRTFPEVRLNSGQDDIRRASVQMARELFHQTLSAV
jgi:hypothetical protein